jgi:hypothetical protein
MTGLKTTFAIGTPKTKMGIYKEILNMTDTDSNFYIATGGTLAKDAPSYIPRQADTDLYNALKQGEFCYLLSSRQTGKSSLMVRVAERLRQES